MINFKCFQCGEGLEVPESLAGQPIKCGSCRQTNLVPPAPEPPAPEPVIADPPPVDALLPAQKPETIQPADAASSLSREDLTHLHATIRSAVSSGIWKFWWEWLLVGLAIWFGLTCLGGIIFSSISP